MGKTTVKLTHFSQLPVACTVDTFWMCTLIGTGLAAALLMRPWRQLAQAELWTPLLAALVVLPWFWALPRLHAMPLQLQLSGAVLVLLCVGWPLAVWVLLAVSLIGDWLAPQTLDAQVRDLFFLGILLAVGALESMTLLGRFATWLDQAVGSQSLIVYSCGFCLMTSIRRTISWSAR